MIAVTVQKSCGSWQSATRKAWAKAARSEADLRYETFVSSGRFAPQSFTVNIPRRNLAITVPANNGLLDELEMAGVQAIYDCRRGECGLCAMDVLSLNGEIDHRDVFLATKRKPVTIVFASAFRGSLGKLRLIRLTARIDVNTNTQYVECNYTYY